MKDQLLNLVDEDTRAFNKIMDAFGPKSTDAEKANRKQAIQDATRYAIEIPFKVMKLSLESFEIIKAMAADGNPNSVSDAGVGALCARAAVYGAYLNVKINAGSYDDKKYVEETLKAAKSMLDEAIKLEAEVLKIAEQKSEG